MAPWRQESTTATAATSVAKASKVTEVHNAAVLGGRGKVLEHILRSFGDLTRAWTLKRPGPVVEEPKLRRALRLQGAPLRAEVVHDADKRGLGKAARKKSFLSKSEVNLPWE